MQRPKNYSYPTHGYLIFQTYLYKPTNSACSENEFFCLQKKKK